MRILYSLRMKKLLDYRQMMRLLILGVIVVDNHQLHHHCLGDVMINRLRLVFPWCLPARCVVVYHLWLSMALVISCIAYGSGLVRMKHESLPDMVMLH
jgi:hypothetical protein